MKNAIENLEYKLKIFPTNENKNNIKEKIYSKKSPAWSHIPIQKIQKSFYTKKRELKKQFKTISQNLNSEVPRLKSNSRTKHMDEKGCTSSNVIVNFPSTNKRQNPICFFHIKDQKAERHDFSKATPESIRPTLSKFSGKIISNL